MTFTLKRKNIEGAMKLGLIPKSISIHIQKLLDSVPDIYMLDVGVKAYSFDGKEIDIGSEIKLKLMALLLAGSKEK